MSAAPEAQGVWTAELVQIPRIRAQTRRWLAPLSLDVDTENDIVLAVNEAATNAVEHAYPLPAPGDSVEVNFWTDHHHLYLEVVDHGRWQPPSADPGYRGRGIVLMQQMVASVSIDPGPDGTRVLLRHPTTW